MEDNYSFLRPDIKNRTDDNSEDEIRQEDKSAMIAALDVTGSFGVWGISQ